MANPLDGLTRVYVYGDEATPEGEAMTMSSRGNSLERALAPPPPTKLEAGLAALKAFVENFGRDFGLAGVPKTHPQRAELEDMNNTLLGLNGRERYQFWPERMIRSGFSLPGEVAQGIEPVVDPNTGRTSVPLIERAQDTAGLAFPGALTQKAGTATLGSGPVRPAMKPETPAPVFYSALEHTISNASAKEMLPGDWAGWIKNQPGVKAEELAWTGLPDWLAQQKGKVSKKDVQAYLDEHKVEIRDVTKGNLTERQLDDAVEAHLEGAIDGYANDFGRDPTPAEVRTMAQEIRDDIRSNPGDYDLGEYGSHKYSKYQLPGGENYREHLLTLPPRGISKEAFAELQAAERAAGNAYDKYLQKMLDKYDPDRSGGARWQNKATPAEYTEFKRLQKEAIQAGDELADAKAGTDKRQPYQSSHWDEPNVLAHVRTNERDVGGVPSLHIEEIQSDWHQEGRKKGYKVPDPEKLPTSIDRIKDGYAVPDAPFKTSWPELALKRMIRMAADEGKTRISWTPGEAQAARYDLSKHVDTVSWDPASGMLKAFKGKDEVIKRKATAEELPAIIGKEAAEKLVNSETRPVGLKDTPHHVIEGEDLKVGGEGMKGFYDNMLPKMVEKLGKQHGVKVKRGNIGEEFPALEIQQTPRGTFQIAEKGQSKPYHDKGIDLLFSRDRSVAEDYLKAMEKRSQPVYYFDIPPAWRDQAVGKGFPLFMQGIPFPLTPVDHDPFKKDKTR